MRELSDVTGPTKVTRATWGQAGLLAGIVMLVVLGYGLPFLGPAASVLLIPLTHRARQVLWPDSSPRESVGCAVLAWVGLWLPATLDFWTPLLHQAGLETSTAWLLIPLCGPEDLATLVLPAAAASALCLLGLVAARTRRRAWPWVAAAWLAPWLHLAAFSALPHRFVC